MHRLTAISVFALLMTVPVWAQRGGGGHGGGFSGARAGGGFSGHGGSFSAGRGSFGGGHISAGRSFSGVHPARGYSRSFVRPPSSRISRQPFLHDGFRGDRFNGGLRGDRFHRGFRNFGFNRCLGYGCRGWGYGYPWLNAGYFDPWWWWDSGSRFDDEYERDRLSAEQWNERSLEEQHMLRQEEAEGDQDAYAGYGPRHDAREREPETDTPEKAAAAPVPDTVLVYRDQHRQEVQNYAIVGQTLWVFAPPRNQKISIADLDIAATAKANDDRGVSFRVPASNVGQ